MRKFWRRRRRRIVESMLDGYTSMNLDDADAYVPGTVLVLDSGDLGLCEALVVNNQGGNVSLLICPELEV